MITITTDPAAIDITLVHQFLSNESYWAKGIPLEIVQKSILNSICFSVLKQNAMIGFARIISDKATFCYLCDVFILEPERGKGYSKQLMTQVMNHPDLQGLRRYILGTADAHGLYSQFGFEPLSTPERMMEIKKNNIYFP